MSRPPTYAVQSSCSNCKKVFAVPRIGQPNHLFCHADAAPRPKCGSFLNNESWGIGEKFTSDQDAWNAWAAGREVHAAGLCDQYEVEAVLMGSNYKAPQP